MIGLSLALCIKDVLDGNVGLGDIDYIVAGTNKATTEAFQELLSVYSGLFWSGWPEEGVRIALELYHAGKVCQPRLANPNHFPVPQNNVRWVQSEDQIVWNDSAEQGAT